MTKQDEEEKLALGELATSPKRNYSGKQILGVCDQEEEPALRELVTLRTKEHRKAHSFGGTDSACGNGVANPRQRHNQHSNIVSIAFASAQIIPSTYIIPIFVFFGSLLVSPPFFASPADYLILRDQHATETLKVCLP